MEKKINIKKAGIIALAFLILFLPTIAAIIVHGAGPVSEPDPTGKNSSSVTLVLPDGSSRTCTAKDNDGRYAMFRSINAHGTEISSLPDSVDKSSGVLGTVHAGDDTAAFTYYFSSDADACYFIDGDRKVYHIAKNDASALLADRELSAFLGIGSEQPVEPGTNTEPGTDKPVDPPVPPDVDFVLPVLTFNGETVIKPETIEWYAADSTGTFYSKKEANSEVSTFQLSSENEVSLMFDNPPSDCHVKAYDTKDSSTLYDGSYSKISLAKIPASTTVKFVISASWKQMTGSNSYGQASYTFFADVDVKIHAEFKLNRTTVNLGEFIILSAVNAENPADIVITSAPALNYTPKFFSDTVNGAKVVSTLLPFSYGMSKGEYNITVQYGEDSKTFKVTVKDYANGYVDGPTTQISAYSQSLVDEICTSAALEEYQSLLADITASSDNVRYAGGTFLDYRQSKVLSAKATLRMGFGRYITIKNASTKFSYEHAGWDFEVASGIEVPAMNSGKVVYVGTSALLGKCVVIDHGFGLMTWYAHLSETSVNIGDIVISGQLIGKTGMTGLSCQKYRLHIGATVYDVPISPDTLFTAANLTFPKFN